MSERTEFSEKILSGLKTQLSGQWEAFSDADRQLIAKVADRAAKLAAAEVSGDSDYVKSHAPLVESMVADLEAVGAMEAASFWHAVLDTSSTILVSLGKKALGLPG